MKLTMRNLHKYIAFVLVLILWSCAQEIIELEQPPSPLEGCNSCPDGAESGTASFDKFVAVGNSYVAGFQAGALFDDGQQNSLAAMIAKQLECAGGSGTFNQPDINSFNGYNIQLSNPGQGIILGRLILFDADGEGPSSAVPAPAGAPGVPAPYDNADLPTSFSGNKAALNNFGVPLIFLGQALIPDTGIPASPYFNPLWARFASNPGVKSIVEDALAAAGSFYLIWLGMDDALLYAVLGADGTYPLTSVEDFNLQYNGLITTMLTINPLFKGVVGNIPSIASYPYFTTLPYNVIELDAVTAAAVQSALGDNYNSFVTAMAGVGFITEEEKNMRLLSYSAGNNGVLIIDESLTDLTDLMLANGAEALTPYAQARQTSLTDLIPLSAGEVLGEPYLGIETLIQGVSWPLGDQHALTITEITQIETNIAGYNSIIDGAAATSNDRLAVADARAAYNNLLGASIISGGLTIDGVSIASTFAPPVSAFSEDGLHPNDRGYAYTANVFIEAINVKFGATVPHICLSDYGGTRLPVSP